MKLLWRPLRRIESQIASWNVCVSFAHQMHNNNIDRHQQQQRVTASEAKRDEGKQKPDSRQTARCVRWIKMLSRLLMCVRCWREKEFVWLGRARACVCVYLSRTDNTNDSLNKNRLRHRIQFHTKDSTLVSIEHNNKLHKIDVDRALLHARERARVCVWHWFGFIADYAYGVIHTPLIGIDNCICSRLRRILSTADDQYRGRRRCKIAFHFNSVEFWTHLYNIYVHVSMRFLNTPNRVNHSCFSRPRTEERKKFTQKHKKKKIFTVFVVCLV